MEWSCTKWNLEKKRNTDENVGWKIMKDGKSFLSDWSELSILAPNKPKYRYMSEGTLRENHQPHGDGPYEHRRTATGFGSKITEEESTG